MLYAMAYGSILCLLAAGKVRGMVSAGHRMPRFHSVRRRLPEGRLFYRQPGLHFRLDATDMSVDDDMNGC